MATIKKTIQNLKPGKQYLLTVKPKDVELNVLLDPASAVRFTIPSDLTQPAELGDLTIVGNYKSIMISFNPSNESDLRGYNYEVYLPEDIAQSGSTYVIINGSTPYLSGFSASNVITVDVPQNSETTNQVDANTGVTTPVTTAKIYYARVQSIDTSANKSAWTPIVASTATTFIDSAHIVNLTASKITAGTIGAHTITMAGGTSVIRSSTFDGVDVGGGSYANATTGWLINGSGRAYFYDATIAGSIDIGGYDSGSFHVDADGNLWSGSGTLVNAPFKVLKEGDVTANTITTKNLTLTGNTSMSTNSKIYLGVGVYNNTNTPFYVDSNSQFSLGNKLTWNGNTLTIQGALKLENGSDVVDATDISNAIDEFGNTIYEDGFIGGLTITSTQMYYGAGSWNSSDTAFYVAANASTGQADFSLGNKLTWNGSTLSVTGSINASSGNIANIAIANATVINSLYSGFANYGGITNAGAFTDGGDEGASSVVGVLIGDTGKAVFQEVNTPKVGAYGTSNIQFGNMIRAYYPTATNGYTYGIRNIRITTSEASGGGSPPNKGDIWLILQ